MDFGAAIVAINIFSIMIVESLLVLFMLFLMFYTRRKSSNEPPGPYPYPIIGNTPFKSFKDTLALTCKLRDKYGDIYRITMGTKEIVVISDCQLMREVFNQQFFSYRPQVYITDIVNQFKDAGIVYSSGEKFRENKRFTVMHMKNLGFGKMKVTERTVEMVERLMNRIRDQNGQPFELAEKFDEDILSLTWSVVTGEEELKSEEFEEIIDVLTKRADVATILFLVNFYPWLKYLVPWLPYYEQKAKKANLNVTNVFRRKIKEIQQRETETGEKSDSLVSMLLERCKEKEQKPDFDKDYEEYNMAKTIEDLFIVGSETLFRTLQWAFLFLVRYPSIQQKIQDELDAVIGKERQPTLDDKKNLPYLEAFSLEILRIRSVGPVGMFIATPEDTKIKGYTIKKGTVLIKNLYAAHRDPKHFTKPEECIPERFLDKEGNLINTEHILPFGCGRRACLGEQMSRNSIFLYLSGILQQFSFRSECDPEKLNLEICGERQVIAPFSYKMTAEPR